MQQISQSLKKQAETINISFMKQLRGRLRDFQDNAIEVASSWEALQMPRKQFTHSICLTTIIVRLRRRYQGNKHKAHEATRISKKQLLRMQIISQVSINLWLLLRIKALKKDKTARSRLVHRRNRTLQASSCSEVRL